MDIFLMTEDFNWVKKVLLSSQTQNHINYSNNFFNNFINKWRFEMSEDLKITLTNNFRVIYNEKIVKMGKNGVIV